MSIRRPFPQQIFITGTDTGVGKTVVAAILASGLAATYWKPIQCGLEGPGDREVVQQMTGLAAAYFWPESYRLRAPLSPHAAAALENIEIDLKTITPPGESQNRPLVVEGAGGIMVPLNRNQFMADLMKRLGFPVVLVARSGLGTINHTLLSLEALRRYGIEIFGVVMNGPRNPGNREAIERYGAVEVLAEIEPFSGKETIDCAQVFAEQFR